MKSKRLTLNDRAGEDGFTLIELMAVVAIVAILASMAYPGYQNILASSRRQDAMDVLTGLASALERHKTANGSYKKAATGDSDTGAPTIYPSQSPINGSTKYYDLKIIEANDSAFIIQAIPIVGLPQEDDGMIELASTNRRGWDEDNSGSLDTSEYVWN